MLWVCLLLLLLLSHQADAVCNESTYSTVYFQRCSQDAQCAYNFNLFEDQFDFFEYLLSTQYLQPRGLNWTEICVSEPVALVVLRDLRVLPICSANHYRDEHHGCQLRGDRLSDEDSAKQHFRFSEFGTILAELGIVLVILYACFKLLKSVDTLFATLRASPRLSPPAAPLTYAPPAHDGDNDEGISADEWPSPNTAKTK